MFILTFHRCLTYVKNANEAFQFFCAILWRRDGDGRI